MLEPCDRLSMSTHGSLSLVSLSKHFGLLLRCRSESDICVDRLELRKDYRMEKLFFTANLKNWRNINTRLFSSLGGGYFYSKNILKLLEGILCSSMLIKQLFRFLKCVEGQHAIFSGRLAMF